MTDWDLRNARFMLRQFLRFMEDERILAPGPAGALEARSHRASEPLGIIAFNCGLLSLDQVEMILEQQKHSRRLFGEIANEAGMLTSPELERLLMVQQLRGVFDVVEAMVLSDVRPIAEVMSALSRFLTGPFGELAATLSGQEERIASR